MKKRNIHRLGLTGPSGIQPGQLCVTEIAWHLYHATLLSDYSPDSGLLQLLSSMAVAEKGLATYQVLFTPTPYSIPFCLDSVGKLGIRVDAIPHMQSEFLEQVIRHAAPSRCHCHLFIVLRSNPLTHAPRPRQPEMASCRD